MIRFYGASENLVSEVAALKARYPKDVRIITNATELNTIIITDGVPVILKHYGFDNVTRLEIGSYLSGAISPIDYVDIEIS